jgi:hypothetical protein
MRPVEFDDIPFMKYSEAANTLHFSYLVLSTAPELLPELSLSKE